MTKNARIEVGVTPSEVSGNPSDRLEDAEPLAGQEEHPDPGLKKTAAILDPA